MKNKPYFLALNRLYGVGPSLIRKLLTRFPRLETLFSSSYEELTTLGITPLLAQAVTTFDMRLVESDFSWQAEAPNRHLLTWEDAEYPWLLKEIQSPPVVLYAEGDVSVLKMHCLGMVGTRKPSPLGAEMALRFAGDLSKQGLCIVSGLALGVDAYAHRGCLAAGGKTVAIMGTGIDTIYPHRHRLLAQEISQHGLLLSEFPLKTQPFAGHFPRRNRIISGLSLGILVVEAAVRSGSLITARLAAEQNREVFAIPGSINNPQARGCHFLLQQGAKLVTSVNDVLDELKLDYLVTSEQTVVSPKASLVLDNHNLLEYIGFEVTSIDQIIHRSGLELYNVTGGLADLEMQGLLKAVAGGYVRCS